MTTTFLDMYDGTCVDDILQIITNNPEIQNMDCWGDYQYCLDAINFDPILLSFANPNKLTKEQYEGLCILAITEESCNFLSIDKEHQTNKMCLVAVKLSGTLLSNVQDKTFEICLAAVSESGDALQYVDHKQFTGDEYKKICLAAVSNDSDAVRFVKNGTCLAVPKEIYDAAVLQYVNGLNFYHPKTFVNHTDS
jgi:hypothetical protein